MTVARRYAKTARRGSGGLMQYWWIGALIGFLLITFTIGPLAPKKQNAEQIRSEQAQKTTLEAPEIQVQSALVQAIDPLAGCCKNPAGGYVMDGDTVLLTDGETIIKSRCNNGTWETETEQETP